jgi:phage shock protein E
VSGNGWIIVAVAVVALLVVRRIAGGKRVSPMVVLEKIKAGAKIVDVRSPGEFQGGAYPGAVNIPVQELDRRAGELRKDQPVVVYCASGMRSASAERLLRAKGFLDVVNGGGLAQMPR